MTWAILITLGLLLWLHLHKRAEAEREDEVELLSPERGEIGQCSTCGETGHWHLESEATVNGIHRLPCGQIVCGMCHPEQRGP